MGLFGRLGACNPLMRTQRTRNKHVHCSLGVLGTRIGRCKKAGE
jgi:hypothetical protein